MPSSEFNTEHALLLLDDDDNDDDDTEYVSALYGLDPQEEEKNVSDSDSNSETE